MDYKEAKKKIRAIMESTVYNGEYESRPFDEQCIIQIMSDIKTDQDIEEEHERRDVTNNDDFLQTMPEFCRELRFADRFGF
jgi:hypothetical protein